MDNAHFEVRVVLDKEGSSAVEGLVFVQCPQPKHLDSLLVCRHDGILDVRVDPLPLRKKNTSGQCFNNWCKLVVFQRAANMQNALPIFEKMCKRENLSGLSVKRHTTELTELVQQMMVTAQHLRAYLSLEEEFNGTCWCHPGLQLQLAQTVLVRDKYFADHETHCQE